MLSLVMNPGLPEERHFPLERGSITIGRTKDNTVYCLHKSLSRRHAQLDYDGSTLTVSDLDSKNGVFHDGKRVSRCQLREGDSFRCGDITFLLEAATLKNPLPGGSLAAFQDRAAQTLPSPFAVDPRVASRPQASPAPRRAEPQADDQRYKDKLFLLIRASELCVSERSIDRVLEELIVLAVQVLDVDRIALLTLDDLSLEMRPRVIKTFVAPTQYPYSTRVVDWVVDHGSPASFADVARDRTLAGDLARDENVRGAMCVPIDPGGGTIGVIYADSISRPDCFRPDDLALLRALANLAAVAIESDALRSGERHTTVDP